MRFRGLRGLFKRRVKRRRGPPELTRSESTARIRELRRQGYTVTRRTLADGTVVVLKSKRKKKR